MTAVEYFLKVPDDVAERPVIIVGAMLVFTTAVLSGFDLLAIGRLGSASVKSNSRSTRSTAR